VRAYFEWVLKHQRWVLGLIFALTVVSAFSVSRAIFASSIGEMFFGDAPPYARYVSLIETFGSDEVFAVAYEESDPLSIAALDRLEAITEDIENDSEVHRVRSLLSLDRIRSEDGMLFVQTYAEAARESPDQRMELLAEIQNDPILSRTLVGASEGSANMMIELTVDPTRSGEVGPRIVEDTLSAFSRHGYSIDHTHRAGFPALMTEMLVQARYALSHILPISVAVLALMVSLLFRTALPVILSMGVSGLSVLFSIGAATALDPKMSIFFGVVPAIVTVVAVSDVIHLWSAYLHELRQGKPKREAILCSAEDVGRACLLTSVTTFVGFVSISLIPTPVFRELGWVLGLGVSAALLLAMTLVPIFANLNPAPTIRAQQMDNIIARFVDSIVSLSSRCSTKHPWWVIAFFAIFTLGSVQVAGEHTIETNFITRLAEDNVIRVDNTFFETEYTGTQTLDVFVMGDDSGAMLEADTLQRFAQFEEELEAHPAIDQAISHMDILRQTHHHLGGEGPIPRSRAAAAQELLLLEMGGGSELDSVLNSDRSAARMTLRIREHRMRATHRLAKDIEAMGQQTLGDTVRVEATGLMALTGGWIDEIITGQRNGVIASIVIITGLMMFGLRSLSIGLISMIPNLLPLVASTALCGLVWEDIDSDTLVVLMMAIGIGVDDTIHFLMRYKIESERCENPSEAIQQTFAFSGRAIVMTTVILAVGFSPMALSDYYSMSIVGSLLPFALVVAMGADLLLVPALAQVGWLKNRLSA